MSDRLYVSTRKGLFAFDRASRGEWQVVGVSFLGDPITAFLDDPHTEMQYAAARHGHFGVKFYRSADHAKTWEECAAPAYPPQPESVEGQPADPHKWNLDQVWILESGGAGTGAIWAGTNPGGLFRSRDCGNSWELVRSLWDHSDRKRWFGGGYDVPGIHSVCVDPRNPNHVRVAISCGGVWQTTDGGESWGVRGNGMRAAYMPPEAQFDPVAQDPHRMVQCPADPEWLWVQHHNGIFVSRDGAENWRELDGVKPSSFGFAVAVHPTDPKTAWFVPATKDERRVPVDGRVVVTRTRDGGESFETLTRGLPQAHAYDIAYRHALDVAADGESLAFGSTTGGLWATDDGGDSWHPLSHNLPPIYSVRFAA
jgi:hypothetical protein